MNIAIKSIALILLFACSACAAHATQDTIEIRTLGFPPYGINNQGELSGIYYDLANLIVANAGYSPNNQIIPYARIVKSIKFGGADLTIMYRNPTLDGYVDYLGALPSKSTVVIGLQDNPFGKIAELSGKKIAYIRGAKFTDQIENDKSIEKHLISSYAQGMRMLIAGRIDALMGPLHPIKTAVSEFNEINHKKIQLGEPLVVETRSPWVQISKKRASYIDIEKLKQSFMELQRKNTFQTLKAKYTPSNKVN